MTDIKLGSFDAPIDVMVQGASHGIGAAFCAALAASPSVAHVVATSRHPEASEALAAVRRDIGDRLVTVPLDVTREASIEAAARAVSERVERLSLIINCAGLLHDGDAVQPERRLSEVTPEALQQSFAVNAWGPLLVAKHFAGLLPRHERAVFASLSARVGSIGDNRLGGWYAYRASKAAQNMFTKNLSIELPRRHRGTLVVALHPGTVDTGLSAPFQSRVPDKQLFDAPRAARQLLEVIDGLDEDDNGGFFAWDGRPIVW
ncbi:SDR family NAD(P)-dependent oxidoreductase [Lentisalinibacter salinarum]|uniref:SDR family NAD(P)-dependent oxidoreductase n=1 Tax=Lentisalinibacter salinarum TaxID=2992239 RepID=UPI003866BD8D